MRTICLIVIGVIAVSTSVGKAGTINWSGAQTISGDSDVRTDGTLAGAFNIGASGVGATTVNGVTFAGFPVRGTSSSYGNFTFTLSTGFGAVNGNTSTNPPFSLLSAPYQTLLSSYAGNPVAAPFTLTMTGLTPGDQYEFGWWANTTATANFSDHGHRG